MPNGQDPIRELIRLIPSARALKRSMEECVHTERFANAGKPAAKLYGGLHASVRRLLDDPYLDSLALEVADDAADEETIVQIHLAVGQLLAYLEGQTGLAGLVESGLHLAPKVAFQGPVHTVSSEMINKLLSEENGEKEAPTTDPGS
jgi:hypothetical protein